MSRLRTTRPAPLWHVDPERSRATVRTVRGTDERVQAVLPAVSGRLSLDLRRPTRTTGQVVVDLRGVHVVPGDALDRLPWQSWIDRTDPVLAFTIHRVRLTGAETAHVTGLLRYRGTDRPAAADVIVWTRQRHLVSGTASVVVPRERLPLPRALRYTPAGRLLPEAVVVEVDLVVAPTSERS